jgi:hypothetical protein
LSKSFFFPQGASVAGFGCFGWELKVKDGVTQSRPIFVLSDQFVKNFKIKRDRIHELPRLTPIEEVNYSLLAIKFSKVLTKDMVFAGLRDVIQKIGDFIYRGYEINIEFSFGSLHCKERRVKFEFNQSRIAEVGNNNFHNGSSHYSCMFNWLCSSSFEQNLPQDINGFFSYDESLLKYVDEDGGNNTERSSSSTTNGDFSSKTSEDVVPKLQLSRHDYYFIYQTHRLGRNCSHNQHYHEQQWYRHR